MVAPPDRREITVTADGQIVLDGQNLSVNELTNRLAAMKDQFPGLRVVVRADGKAEHQFVAAVYGAVNRAGVADMSIAVRFQPSQFR
jgi:biopolymer transport protein ExbD